MCDPTACVRVVVWRTREGEETIEVKYGTIRTWIQILQLGVLTWLRSVFRLN